jgi:DNA-binding transcriptional LysR family regulator
MSTDVDRLQWLFQEAVEYSSVRVFAAVAEDRSFSRAAERLHLAPWLSTQVRNLEARMGLQLFERSPRHVELTVMAERLLPIARGVIATIEDAAAAAGTYGSTARDRGVLRLGAPTYTIHLARRVQLLEAFADQHPEIEIAIDNDHTTELLPRLRSRRLDAALLLAPVDTDGLATIPFVRLVNRLQIPAGHPLAASSTITRAQLRGARIATWRAEVNPEAWEHQFGPLRDAGAILVPL